MDERLSTAARLFPKVTVGADIGANHGLLACELLASGKAQYMWVTDLSEDALRHARQNVLSRNFTAEVSFAVGNGFSVLPQRVDAAAILGMGGQTIAGILRTAADEQLPDCIIASAHTEQEEMRRAFYEQGYSITQEEIVISAGRYYILELALRNENVRMPEERALFLGPCLSGRTDSVYSRYLMRRLSAYQPSRSLEGIQRYQWLREEAARAAADSTISL